MFAGGGGGDSIRLPRGSESYSPESALSKRRWSYDRATFAVRPLGFNELCEPVRRASQGAAVARGAAQRQRTPRCHDECYDVHGMSTMHDILELGGAVRAARTRAGMTQSALAAACGLSRQTVAQLEAGSFSDLGIRKIERVLAQLGLRLRVETDAAADSPASGRSRLGHL